MFLKLKWEQGTTSPAATSQLNYIHLSLHPSCQGRPLSIMLLSIAL